jgi:hypothetical protein
LLHTQEMCELFIENDFKHAQSSYFLIHLIIVAIKPLKNNSVNVTDVLNNSNA